MEGHDNMQHPAGEIMKEGNEAAEQDEKRVTLEIDIWYMVFKQVRFHYGYYLLARLVGLIITVMVPKETVIEVAGKC
jgi:hypothetical protein